MTKILSSQIASLPIGKPRNLYFHGDVTQDTTGRLITEIIEINEHDRYLEAFYNAHGQVYLIEPIKIYIDSYGGSVYQAFGLLGVMDSSVTEIHTYVTGVAMSCGFLMAIHGHRRFAHKHSTFMYHQLSSAAWGTLNAMKQSVEQAEKLQRTIERLTVSKTLITEAQLKYNFEHKENWYMDVHDAKRYGCVDEIV
jgi:ATP-dependent Clp protease, protease subunit